jgi:hypothetical protein
MRRRNADCNGNEHADGNADNDGHGNSNSDRSCYLHTSRNTDDAVRSDDQCSDDGDEFAELRGGVRPVR